MESSYLTEPFSSSFKLTHLLIFSGCRLQVVLKYRVFKQKQVLHLLELLGLCRSLTEAFMNPLV